MNFARHHLILMAVAAFAVYWFVIRKRYMTLPDYDVGGGKFATNTDQFTSGSTPLRITTAAP